VAVQCISPWSATTPINITTTTPTAHPHTEKARTEVCRYRFGGRMEQRQHLPHGTQWTQTSQSSTDVLSGVVLLGCTDQVLEGERGSLRRIAIRAVSECWVGLKDQCEYWRAHVHRRAPPLAARQCLWKGNTSGGWMGGGIAFKQGDGPLSRMSELMKERVNKLTVGHLYRRTPAPHARAV